MNSVRVTQHYNSQLEIATHQVTPDITYLVIGLNGLIVLIGWGLSHLPSIFTTESSRVTWAAIAAMPILKLGPVYLSASNPVCCSAEHTYCGHQLVSWQGWPTDGHLCPPGKGWVAYLYGGFCGQPGVAAIYIYVEWRLTCKVMWLTPVSKEQLLKVDIPLWPRSFGVFLESRFY